MPKSSRDHRVLCIGDMTVDILANPVRELPAPSEVALTDEIACVPGGNALNTAVALQRLGEAVSFVGTIGDDGFGDMLVAQLEKTGIDARGIRREPNAATPVTLIYRRESEDRRFIHALGAAATFTGEHVPLELVPEGGVVHVGGYLKLEAWNDEALAGVLQHARSRGCNTVLNVCIPRGATANISRCLELVPLVDVFVHNEHEARLLTGESEAAAQARALRDAGANSVIITAGEQGLYADDGERVIRMGVYPVPIRDPSGCGDCFNAGLITALLRRWDTVRALEYASAVAAFGVQALGATTGVPPHAEVERFVEQNTVSISVDSTSVDGGGAA